MIRPAKPSDLDKVTELGIESLKNNKYEDWFVIDADKVRKTTKEAISSARDFVWVSEIEGEVVGAVGALSLPFQFFEREQCSVVMFYCRQSGDGGKLLRQLFRWYMGRPMLKRLEFTIDENMKNMDRIMRFLGNLGLSPDLPVYNHLKGRK